MQELYNKILKALQNEDKESAVRLSINALSEASVSISELYEVILVPALNNILNEYSNEEELIWREHVRSGIIRTIIESAYPFVLAEKRKLGLDQDKGKVIVICPTHEDHELGARMASDFFKLAGFDSTFIGARTPLSTIHKAVEVVQPDYICISVTNYYNLVSVKEMIQTIKAQTSYPVRFIVGGRAFRESKEAFTQVEADYLTLTFDDIKKFEAEGY